ncbi:hypothetical protein Anapl_17684 [Anas platyrhynchos]|uniref:Uncharacterized protein n=1 Tax=Anas platyrhynchos TaxID=8839 RepID=R0M685_ANAPL|nr:hypothetical protein Anapl_17684 [Anas platyrhynchos]
MDVVLSICIIQKRSNASLTIGLTSKSGLKTGCQHDLLTKLLWGIGAILSKTEQKASQQRKLYSAMKLPNAVNCLRGRIIAVGVYCALLSPYQEMKLKNEAVLWEGIQRSSPSRLVLLWGSHLSSRLLAGAQHLLPSQRNELMRLLSSHADELVFHRCSQPVIFIEVCIESAALPSPVMPSVCNTCPLGNGNFQHNYCCVVSGQDFKTFSGVFPGTMSSLTMKAHCLDKRGSFFKLKYVLPMLLIAMPGAPMPLRSCYPLCAIFAPSAGCWVQVAAPMERSREDMRRMVERYFPPPMIPDQLLSTDG